MKLNVKLHENGSYEESYIKYPGNSGKESAISLSELEVLMGEGCCGAH